MIKNRRRWTLMNKVRHQSEMSKKKNVRFVLIRWTRRIFRLKSVNIVFIRRVLSNGLNLVGKNLVQRVEEFMK